MKKILLALSLVPGVALADPYGDAAAAFARAYAQGLGVQVPDTQAQEYRNQLIEQQYLTNQLLRQQAAENSRQAREQIMAPFQLEQPARSVGSAKANCLNFGNMTTCN